MHCTTYFRPVASLAPQLFLGVPFHVAPSAAEFFASWMSGCGQVAEEKKKTNFLLFLF
jgi:hypothetical protein